MIEHFFLPEFNRIYGKLFSALAWDRVTGMPNDIVPEVTWLLQLEF